MSKKEIPTITFPTSDFESVVRMSNLAVVRIFREHVWSIRQRLRSQVVLPEDHDSYAVIRSAGRVTVTIMHEGATIFRCIFVPPQEY